MRSFTQLRLKAHRYSSILLLLFLSACSGGDMADLKDYVDKINARRNTDVPQLPVFKHIPSFFYEVEHMRDPFLETSGLLGNDKAITEPTKEKECPHPDPYRVRVGLELLPLDAMQMVGTLEDQAGTLWGLVISKSDGTIHRVQAGDHIGQNYGKIIGVYEDKIEVLEMIPDSSGCFSEEISTLALVE